MSIPQYCILMLHNIV